MRRAATFLAFSLMLSGCASTAPPPNGSLIPANERVVLDEISGESLLDPNSTVTTRDPSGAITVLNVWGAWCSPCRFEAPELEQAREATSSDNVRFIGINVRDHDRDFAADFALGVKMGYPSIYDPAARTLLTFGKYRNVAVPTTLVIDSDGRVAAVFIGAVLADDILPRIRQVLAERVIP